MGGASAENATKIITVNEATNASNFFYFHIIAYEQCFGSFPPDMIEIFIEANASVFLKNSHGFMIEK